MHLEFYTGYLGSMLCLESEAFMALFVRQTMSYREKCSKAVFRVVASLYTLYAGHKDLCSTYTGHTFRIRKVT